MKPTRLVLRPGLSLSVQVPAESMRTFTFKLHRDQYLALRVTQESRDVTLTLHLPGMHHWAPLDTQTVLPVPELLKVVTPFDGLYVLEIQAKGTKPAGAYRLEVMELRPATPLDRLAAKAQERLAEAEELRRGTDKALVPRALPLYEEAVGLFKRTGDAGGEGYARVQWARALKALNRKEEAAACLRESLKLAPAAQAPGNRAAAATMLGEVSFDLGNGAEAEAASREALADWTQLGQPTWRAKAINDLAHGATKRGELALAESLFRQALSLWEGNGHASDTQAAVVLGNLASLYNLAGEPQLALDAAEQGMAKFPAGSRPEQEGDLLAQKGEALASLGRGEESRQAFTEALKIGEKSGPAALAQLERHLARQAYDQGNLDEASRRFQKAFVVLESIQNHQSAIDTGQDLAWTELKLGHLAVAEQLFQKIFAEAGPSEHLWIKPAALAGRARLERKRGHLKPALALARQALTEVEHLRRELGRTDLQTSVFADQQSYFDLAADLALDLYGQTHDRSLLAEAFETSERSRSRRLLDLLTSDRSSPTGKPGVGETRAAKALSQAEERLATLRSTEAEAPEIEAADREVREAVLDLRREDPPAAAAKPGFGGIPLSFRQIQRWLDRDTVLLELDLGEDASYLWVVSSHTLSVHRLPRREQVEALARKAVSVLSTSGASADSAESRETLLATSRLLLREAMPELKAPRWLVVMDGTLHALPLGALPNPENPEEALLATHEIAYAPSASVAVRLSERERRPGTRPRKDLALFADAVYEIEGAATRPAPGALRLHLPRLRYTDDETRRILPLARPEERLDARRFEATKARVLSGELEDYRQLHFAVHGLPNESHPELSGLALSLFDRQGKPQDGILFAYEIARLHLPADLAVLSACQSARGAAVSGEGLVGLVHAFFTAGTARVVASDWAVNDQATAELMNLFYDRLRRQHLSPARALQQAQMALAREGAWHRPYYWAGFVVQGGF